jgi:hypothetical protein
MHLLPILREIVTLALAGWALFWTWMKTRGALSWPSAQGTVSGASVQTAGSKHLKPWVGQLTYTYIVNGEYYSGSHFIGAVSKKRAEDAVEGWSGRLVVVRYSPVRHEDSVLVKSDQPGGQLGN